MSPPKLLLAASFLAMGVLSTPTSVTHPDNNILPRQGWQGPYASATKCTCSSKEGKTHFELLCEGVYGLPDYGRVEKGWNVVITSDLNTIDLVPSADHDNSLPN